ncbi:hypothetical protein [Halosimplex sp. J119]
MANSQQYGNDTQDTNPIDRAGRNNGKTRLMDKNEALINPATEETLSSTLSREIAQWSAGTLPVEQQTPVALEDTTGTQVDPLDQGDAEVVTATDSGTGSGNAAELDLGALRSAFDVFVDTTGSATLTVQVSTDGQTWRTFETINYSSDTEMIEQFETSYQHVRAYLDQARNVVEMSAKGVA